MKYKQRIPSGTYHLRLLFGLQLLVQLSEARRPVVRITGPAEQRGSPRKWLRARAPDRGLALVNHLSGAGNCGVVQLEIHENG